LIFQCRREYRRSTRQKIHLLQSPFGVFFVADYDNSNSVIVDIVSIPLKASPVVSKPEVGLTQRPKVSIPFRGFFGADNTLVGKEGKS
jgi:hypothetical protein